jgi:hypothetical protein
VSGLDDVALFGVVHALRYSIPNPTATTCRCVTEDSKPVNATQMMRISASIASPEVVCAGTVDTT